MSRAGGLGALRRFSRPASDAVEWCDGCRTPLRAAHEHRLVLGESPSDRRLECVCGVCAAGEGAGLRAKRVPRVCIAMDMAASDVEWEGLGVPIRLAFLVRSGDGGDEARPLAFFPSPAGAIELQPDRVAWNRMASRSRVFGALRPDVEALLLHHAHPPGDAGPAAHQYVVSIDVCYRLVGLVRAHWRGFGGGAEVWARIGALFDELAGEARRA